MKLTVLGCNGAVSRAGRRVQRLFFAGGRHRCADGLRRGRAGAAGKAHAATELNGHRAVAPALRPHERYAAADLPLPRPAGLFAGSAAAVRALLENAFELHDIAQGGQIGCLRMTACPGRHPVPAYAARFENGDGRALSIRAIPIPVRRWRTLRRIAICCWPMAALPARSGAPKSPI